MKTWNFSKPLYSGESPGKTQSFNSVPDGSNLLVLIFCWGAKIKYWTIKSLSNIYNYQNRDSYDDDNDGDREGSNLFKSQFIYCTPFLTLNHMEISVLQVQKH